MNIGELTANGSTPWFQPHTLDASVQVVLEGTGAVAANVEIEVSNDGVNPVRVKKNVGDTHSFVLSGTTLVTDNMVVAGVHSFIRMTVSGLSGTGATVRLLLASGKAA